MMAINVYEKIITPLFRSAGKGNYLPLKTAQVKRLLAM